ncbi:MAG: hypothetical protein LIP09_03685 [Bacteroidales bacterium]|nr:hypothetical protein [Bacteroidales bacterium]
MKGKRIFLLITAVLIALSMHSGPQWKDSIQLNEVVVNAKEKRMLHILAYVRDYSTLYTYTDTALLFREKWIDFMLPTSAKAHYKGWNWPRILSTESYYQFKNKDGRDSVSDKFNQHFSWSDWIGLINPVPIPQKMLNAEVLSDTIHGKYSPVQIWHKNGDHISFMTNAMVDTTSRKFIPGLSTLFRPSVNVFEDEGEDWWNRRNSMEFDKFKLTFDFRNITSDTLSIRDLEILYCDVESRGRGRNMFQFNPYDEPFFVDTHLEIYFVDKEYIPVKEAKKWEKHNFVNEEFDILPLPEMVPPISDEIADLKNRVKSLKETDEAMTRAKIKVDRRLAGKPLDGYTNKEVILKVLKNMVGLKSKRKYNSK